MPSGTSQDAAACIRAWLCACLLTEVDMYDVAILVEHDVAIVSVLHLQDVAGDGVTRCRQDEVALCTLEGGTLRGAERLNVVIQQRHCIVLAHLIASGSVRHTLN